MSLTSSQLGKQSDQESAPCELSIVPSNQFPEAQAQVGFYAVPEMCADDSINKSLINN